MNNKKFIAAIAAGALALGCTIGGTVAWLTAKTTTITNTFTDSDVNVTLNETTGNSYKMIPGWTIEKNPTATVSADSEDCFLFVQVTKENAFDTYMTYEMDPAWTPLTGVDGVYYIEFDSNDAVTTDVKGQAYPILKDNQVKVKGEVTKAQMDALTEANYPKLSFTAYAVQLDDSNTTEFTPAKAWENRPTA